MSEALAILNSPPNSIGVVNRPSRSPLSVVVPGPISGLASSGLTTEVIRPMGRIWLEAGPAQSKRPPITCEELRIPGDIASAKELKEYLFGLNSGAGLSRADLESVLQGLQQYGPNQKIKAAAIQVLSEMHNPKQLETADDLERVLFNTTFNGVLLSPQRIGFSDKLRIIEKFLQDLSPDGSMGSNKAKKLAEALVIRVLDSEEIAKILTDEDLRKSVQLGREGSLSSEMLKIEVMRVSRFASGRNERLADIANILVAKIGLEEGSSGRTTKVAASSGSYLNTGRVIDRRWPRVSVMN